MSKMIFVNLPVAHLDKAKAFYAALGFVNEPRFTDETAAAMQWSDVIVVMLLTHAKWQTFTDRPIPDRGSSEVMLALSFESKSEVDRITDLAAAHGGTADVNRRRTMGSCTGAAFSILTATSGKPSGWTRRWPRAARPRSPKPANSLPDRERIKPGE